MERHTHTHTCRHTLCLSHMHSCRPTLAQTHSLTDRHSTCARKPSIFQPPKKLTTLQTQILSSRYRRSNDQIKDMWRSFSLDTWSLRPNPCRETQPQPLWITNTHTHTQAAARTEGREEELLQAESSPPCGRSRSTLVSDRSSCISSFHGYTWTNTNTHTCLFPHCSGRTQ